MASLVLYAAPRLVTGLERHWPPSELLLYVGDFDCSDDDIQRDWAHQLLGEGRARAREGRKGSGRQVQVVNMAWCQPASPVTLPV